MMMKAKKIAKDLARAVIVWALVIILRKVVIPTTSMEMSLSILLVIVSEELGKLSNSAKKRDQTMNQLRQSKIMRKSSIKKMRKVNLTT
jgi:hypothetical protein